MIEPTWNRISAIHLEDDGTVGAVWLALDTVTSVLHIYDAAVFKQEVEVVIREGIACRGRRIPLAWRKQDKPMAEQLLEHGINVLHDPCGDTQAYAEVISREIWSRLRTGRLRVDKTVAEWLREYKNYYKDRGQVPLAGFPLMAATRHAIEMLNWAQPEHMPGSRRLNHPKVAIV